MSDTRRQAETHWRMNPRSRAIFDRIEAAADEALAELGSDGLTVVEVGCGQQSNVVFAGATRVIGVDVDEPALNCNATVTHPVLQSANDLELPDVVFGTMARALRPGGVMVIAVPQVRSPKALVTRYTPQWFHEWFYRNVLGRSPDTNGTPFDTVLDPAIAPERLRRLAAAPIGPPPARWPTCWLRRTPAPAPNNGPTHPVVGTQTGAGAPDPVPTSPHTL